MCGQQTVEEWKGGASAGTAAPSAMIVLTGPEAGGAVAAVGATLTSNGAREEAVPAMGGVEVVAADGRGQGTRVGRTDAGSGSSGKGKEPAWAEAGPEAGDEGAATSAGAGAVGGGSKGKGRVGNGWQGSLGGKRSRGESGGGPSMHSGGAGSSRAAEEQSGKGSNKRAAPDEGAGGRSGGGKRARARQPGNCEYIRLRSQCKECGGGGICQHNRQRSKCKECGGGSICQHNRRRSSNGHAHTGDGLGGKGRCVV